MYAGLRMRVPGIRGRAEAACEGRRGSFARWAVGLGVCAVLSVVAHGAEKKPVPWVQVPLDSLGFPGAVECVSGVGELGVDGEFSGQQPFVGDVRDAQVGATAGTVIRRTTKTGWWQGSWWICRAGTWQTGRSGICTTMGAICGAWGTGGFCCGLGMGCRRWLR